VTKRQRHRFYIVLALVLFAIFVGGIFAGYAQRNDKLCKDGRPPKAQQDFGLGQISYLCHNGQVVQK
jgi:hypothetical protein